jgi:hypothetical protein
MITARSLHSSKFFWSRIYVRMATCRRRRGRSVSSTDRSSESLPQPHAATAAVRARNESTRFNHRQPRTSIYASRRRQACDGTPQNQLCRSRASARKRRASAAKPHAAAPVSSVLVLPTGFRFFDSRSSLTDGMRAFSGAFRSTLARRRLRPDLFCRRTSHSTRSSSR